MCYATLQMYIHQSGGFDLSSFRMSINPVNAPPFYIPGLKVSRGGIRRELQEPSLSKWFKPLADESHHLIDVVGAPSS
ncbi:unnamed protein product [Soboliphyme baturini]|uniref:Uncharacterized protein n=1 Tax=Soboliphyme baturini TaxID=241478 RepID=A0A183J100_9BILA|nr:unnamed protein product [Soboliphyme baturini]